MRLIFAQNLRTIRTSAEEKYIKFSIKVVNKTTASAAQFAKCILLHAYSRSTAALSSQLREHKQKLHIPVAYLTSWHNNILGYKLRTIEAENL